MRSAHSGPDRGRRRAELDRIDSHVSLHATLTSLDGLDVDDEDALSREALSLGEKSGSTSMTSMEIPGAAISRR